MTMQSSPVVLLVKKLPANVGDGGDRFDSWVGKIPGGGHSNPLQSSCLETPMDGGAWRAPVHRVTKRRARLK